MKKKILCILLCICMLASCVFMASCDNDTSANDTDETTTSAETESETEVETAPVGERVEYVLTVKSEGNLPLGAVEFEIYADEALTTLRARGDTNSNGIGNFKLPEANYYLKIVSAPDGYLFDEVYAIGSRDISITLTSYIRDNAPNSNFRYQTGDVVHNFALSSSGDKIITVKDALEEYECVVLNFWYIGCVPCKAEFPYMQSAYNSYKDKVGLFALNGSALETDQMISDFMVQNGYTFPTGKADNSILNYFGISAFPTTIVIDKFGVICLIEVGSIPSEDAFVELFELYSSPSYTQTEIKGYIE